MKTYLATSYNYTIIRESLSFPEKPCPYILQKDGNILIYNPSPLHGRSYIVGKTKNGRFIVSKGNGLSYSQFRFLHTGEAFNYTWGLLLRRDAERDFILGQEIEALGIKTNHMEYVLKIDTQLTLPNGHTINPYLLQYDVESPYRICDAPFMNTNDIYSEVEKWEKMNEMGYNERYLVAANVLIKNLRILHDKKILHNAIHEQNYTWALELLDFELASSPMHPYDSQDNQLHFQDLFSREIIYTYVIINYIAGVLNEKIDYSTVDALFEKYGFDIKQFIV